MKNLPHVVVIVIVPGLDNCITPAYAHITFDTDVNAGLPAISTFTFPGVQGAGITGIQGIGVKTPNAAAVADATVGFAILLHIPKGIIFFIGNRGMGKPGHHDAAL